MTTETTMATLTLTDGQQKNLATMAAIAAKGGKAQAAIHADLDRLTADVKAADKAKVVDAYSTAARAYLKDSIKDPKALKLALAALSTALTRYRKANNMPAKRAAGAGRKSKEESTDAGKAETVNLADLTPAEHVAAALAALLTGLARLGPSERKAEVKRIAALLKQVPTK